MAQNNTPTHTPTNTTPTQGESTTTATTQGVNQGPAPVKGVDMGMIVDTSGPNINPAALDSSAAIQARAASGQTAPVNFTAMAFGKSETLNKPAAGQVTTFQASAGEQFKVNFDPNAAQLSVRNGDLVFTFNDGAQIVIDNFVQASAQMPSLALPDGTILAGGVVVAQLTGQSADDLFDIETAAGPNAAGGGNFIYSDNLGGVIDLLNKLPPIPFVEMANISPDDREPLPLLNPNFTPPEQLAVGNLVDETGGFGLNPDGSDKNNHVTGTIPADYGRDGAGTVGLKPDFSYDGSVAGGVLTSHGNPVVVTHNGNTITGTATDANGVVSTVFVMTVNPDGTYDFKLLDQLDHADKSDPDDRLDLHFTYVVSDRDGDEGLGSITIGVKDDGPQAVDDSNHVNIVVNEYNVIGGAPDFPALQEQTNLPQNRPDLFAQGTAKASDVVIDKATTVTVERIKTVDEVAGANSPLFAFTQDAQGNITNVQLLFGNAVSNDSNNGPTHAEYAMTSGGKLGFFIVTNMAEKLVEIGAVDANGKINPDFSFKLVPTPDGKYGVEYTHQGESKMLGGDARFGGDFLGQDVHGVAGRQDGDTNNQLRYGFEDMPYEHADMDFNDVQFKVTINPSVSETSVPAKGNVLINDDVGQDVMHDKEHDSVVTQVGLKDGTQISFNNPTGTDQGGKYVTIQGEYGVLKMYENGDYTYTYNTGKKDGDLKDNFTYTMRDYDGDTSSADLNITLGVSHNYAPGITPTGSELHEDALVPNGPAKVVEEITIDSPDGIGKIELTDKGLPDLYSGGKKVEYEVSPDGKTLTGTVDGEKVLTVELKDVVDNGNGSHKVDYEFTLEKPLDNPGPGKNVTNIPVQVVVTDKDGDKTDGTIPLKVVDDVPVAVDDSNSTGKGTTAQGNIITNDNFGADGSDPSASKVDSITYNGVTKTFPTPDATVSFTTPKGVLEIKGDGSYTFTRTDKFGDINDVFTYTIKDKDGDISTAKLTITGGNNPVTIITPDPKDPAAGGNGAIIREDDLLVPGVDSVTKDIIFKAPDGVESIKLTTDGLPALQSEGNPVTYSLSPDGKTLTGSAGGQPVFTVVLGSPVQQPDGDYKTPYTFTLLKPLDNPGTGENVTDIPAKFVATDTDGDYAVGTLPLKVVDDVPVANDDVNFVADRGSVDGNIITGAGQNGGADVMSADQTKLVSVSFGGTTKSFADAADVQTDANGKFVTINGQYGSLKLYENGNYTYKHNNGSGSLVDQFNYRITDRDGDTDTATLTINIENGVPSIPDVQGGKSVDETHDINVALTGTIAYTNGIAVAFGQANGSAGFVAEGSLLNGALTSNGQPVNVALINGQYIGYTGSDPNAAGAKVFELTLNGNDYSFKLLSNLDHADGDDANDVISLNFAVTANDADGDKATGMLKIDVLDDAPVANPDSNQAITIIREFNILGNAPDFPTLQEQLNLINDRPDLYKLGVDKASNVHIDLPTTVVIERLKSTTGEVAGLRSSLFAFTQDENGNITNLQLVFGVATSNPDDHGPMTNTYEMQSGGKLGFMILQNATQEMRDIGAIDSNGNLQPGYSFRLVEVNGEYKVEFSHADRGTHILGSAPLFGGDMVSGQPVQGVAGRLHDDPINVLRYGFEDVQIGNVASDQDYNDVQFKITVNPLVTEVTDPITGNVLANDNVGQDDMPGIQYGTKVTQVALGNGAFSSLTGTDENGKFITLQGVYGLLKMYENGDYTYTYNTGKKDGSMVDDFLYTMRDNDGDTSTTSLTISINLEDHRTDTSILSAKTMFVAEAHDVEGQLGHDAAAYGLGHQGSDVALNESLTSHGEIVNSVVIDNVVHGFVGPDYESRSADVFTLSLDDTGHYAFDLHDQIDQAASGTVISFDYNAKESDGSVVEGKISIGVEGDRAVAVASPAASDSLSLEDVLGTQDGDRGDSADGMNHVASIDIINDILSDDDPSNGYAGG